MSLQDQQARDFRQSANSLDSSSSLRAAPSGDDEGEAGSDTSFGHFEDALDCILTSVEDDIGGVEMQLQSATSSRSSSHSSWNRTPPRPALVPVTPSSEDSPLTPPNETSASAASYALSARDMTPRTLDPELAGMEKDDTERIAQTRTRHPPDNTESPTQTPQPSPPSDATTEEIEQLIRQLDEIETHYSDKLLAAQEKVREKDAIINALGHNLSELKDENLLLRRDLKQERDAVHLLQEELGVAKAKVVQGEEERMLMEADHAMAMQEEVKRLEAKAIHMEEKVIASAQQQFGEAKAAYNALLGERDELRAERDSLSSELKAAHDAMAKAEAKSMSEEADLLARIAELKAEVAASRAETAAVQERFEGAFEEAKERAQLLEKTLEQNKKECKEAMQNLASTQSDNERLSQENTELSGLCEELMSIVEAST